MSTFSGYFQIPCLLDITRPGGQHIPRPPFSPILELQDQEIGKFYVVQKRRATYFEALKLFKGRSRQCNIITYDISLS